MLSIYFDYDKWLLIRFRSSKLGTSWCMGRHGYKGFKSLIGHGLNAVSFLQVVYPRLG